MDPASLASMPGDFSAIGEDGSTVYLQSLGAAWVDAKDENGKSVVVHPGSAGLTLDLKSQAIANCDKLGSTPEIWSFNEALGKWELESVPMKVNGQLAPTTGLPTSRPLSQVSSYCGEGEEDEYDGSYNPNALATGCMSPEKFKKAIQSSGEKSISTNITKIGYINCDLAYHHPQRAVMLTGLIMNSQGKPCPGMQLWSVGRDYQGRTPDTTDSNGKFGAMIAQFDSDVDIEVHVKKLGEGDSKMDVFFDHNDWQHSSAKEELRLLPGQYKSNGNAVGGQPVWELQRKEDVKNEVPPITIQWCQERRQWHHKLGDRIMFVKDADDNPTAPFGEGWRPSSTLQSIAVAILPVYERATMLHKQMVGPFKTGPPGEFVDVGQITVEI
eukprot:gnl/MRDRNA2_/MRDRNA2_181019_c0_seq1.p1 gnl/MRDRNA2_/MRDRNA2_181019_c0~~gnl/MRDRNA2_/MRDRNA2_181019_c0_seq1.p1  ORF type:complete len:415 (+),score=59.81 gnl/MRDRNA2_/MRDRNA2_181019_c0_seq1:96-1247(+)